MRHGAHLPFLPCCEKEFPVGSLKGIIQQVSQLQGEEALEFSIRGCALNTVIEALGLGVPLVAIPVTYDQPGGAARIADKKTGLFVPLKDLSAPRLSELLDEVINDSAYRENARYFQKAIADRKGLSVAGDLLEEAFGLGMRSGKLEWHSPSQLSGAHS